jgi:hypothetical protein
MRLGVFQTGGDVIIEQMSPFAAQTDKKGFGEMASRTDRELARHSPSV